MAPVDDIVYTVSMANVKIAPSILSADLTRLGAEIADVERGGADWIHVDVMDGRFVPNITLGPIGVSAARRSTQLPVDVHLMIVEPELHVAAFANAGADSISVQVEATVHLERLLKQIRALGKRAGAVVNPQTSEDSLKYVLECLDLILVMTVNPGFGGQSFLPAQLPKIEAIRKMIDRAGLTIELQVDGGIAPDTTRQVVDAGATVLVAGSAIFGQPDRKAAIAALRRAGSVA
ncbi:MAG TPA: ribulose-phosphate 3-epimerase [Polyangiaceae bacterium]|nr:ribulose-phosphate 3-epimerase [Polyangiaceae bacterium]